MGGPVPVRRLGAALGGAGIALLALPGAVLAHQLTGVFESPIPLPVYLAGAAAAVGLSFAVVFLREVRGFGPGDPRAIRGPAPAPGRPARRRRPGGRLDRGPGRRRRLERCRRLGALPVDLRVGGAGPPLRRPRPGLVVAGPLHDGPRRGRGPPAPGRDPGLDAGALPRAAGPLAGRGRVRLLRLAGARRDRRRRRPDARGGVRRLRRGHPARDGPVRARRLAGQRRGLLGLVRPAGPDRPVRPRRSARGTAPCAGGPFGAGLLEPGWSSADVALAAIGVASVLYDGLSQTQAWFDLVGLPGLGGGTVGLGSSWSPRSASRWRWPASSARRRSRGRRGSRPPARAWSRSPPGTWPATT